MTNSWRSADPSPRILTGRTAAAAGPSSSGLRAAGGSLARLGQGFARKETLVRVLVTTWAWTSHFLPLVPLSWALRGNGHELAVASTASLMPSITAAGLPAVALGKDNEAEVRQLTRWYFKWLTDRSAPVSWPEVRAQGTSTVEMYRMLADTSIDDMLEFSAAWHPDLVIYDPTTFAGPLVAAVLGVPAVRHLWGMDYTYLTHEFEPVALAEVCARIGLPTVEPLGDVTVDPCPPSLQLDVGTGLSRLPMRFVSE